MVGLRPIIEFMTFSFSLVAFDQVVNNAPKHVHDVGWSIQYPDHLPRARTDRAHQLGATHSHATENLYANAPGLESLHAGHAARRERFAQNSRARQQSGAGSGSGTALQLERNGRAAG